MKIIVLNGSPHLLGTTKKMVDAFVNGAKEAGNEVFVFSVCQMKISGCMACEYCHTKGNRHCVIQDDMQKIYPVLEDADMIVLASPIYYHGLSAQLQCAIHRIYALDKPSHLKKASLFLSSGDGDVYDGAIYEYQRSFLEYLNLEDLGVYKIAEKTWKENPVQLDELLERINHFGKSLMVTGK